MFDSDLNKLTLCIRFPVEFPMSPPEAWLRRPRMRYRPGQSGGSRGCAIACECAGWDLPGPVTFGGRVCSAADALVPVPPRSLIVCHVVCMSDQTERSVGGSLASSLGGGIHAGMLLASAGWQPATSMLAVLKEVQQSLVESGIEANTTVCVKKACDTTGVGRMVFGVCP